MNESLTMDDRRRMTIGVITRYCCQSSADTTCTITVQHNNNDNNNNNNNLTRLGQDRMTCDVRSPRSVAWRLIASIPKNTTDRFSLVLAVRPRTGIRRETAPPLRSPPEAALYRCHHKPRVHPIQL